MKKQVMKKIIGLFLVLTLACGIVGCAATNGAESKTSESKASESKESASTKESVSEAKKPVTLEMYFRGNGMQQDTQKVEDHVNELLKEYKGLEHVTVKLNIFTSAEYKDQILLAQSAGKQMDIIQSYKLDYNTEVENGTFLPLDDYLNGEFSGLKEELPDWLWQQVIRNGSTYVVPVYQIGATPGFVNIPTEYMQYVKNVDAFKSLDIHNISTVIDFCNEIENLTVAVRDAKNTKTKYCWPVANSLATHGSFLNSDMLDQKSGFLLIDGDTTVTNIYMTEAYKEACKIAAEWVEEGLLPVDATVRDTSLWETSNMLGDESYTLTINNNYGDEATVSGLISKTYGFDTTAICMYDQYFFRANWAAGGSGIGANCKNPYEAMLLIEALNTEKGKEIYNTLVYGLEGVHYEKIDENHIKTLEYDGSQGGTDTSYAGLKWIIGNTSYAYLNQGCAEGDIEIVKSVNDNPNNKASILMGGFSQNLDPVSSEIAQCTAVIEQYHKALAYGSKGKDWEAYYNEFIEKLEIAGVNKVLDYMQQNVDAFLSSK